jgi:hypothetical protein
VRSRDCELDSARRVKVVMQEEYSGLLLCMRSHPANRLAMLKSKFFGMHGRSGAEPLTGSGMSTSVLSRFTLQSSTRFKALFAQYLDPLKSYN